MSDWRNIYLSRECMLSHVQLFATPWLLCPWDSPGKNTRVSCHFLPQGIFPTQGSNPFPASPTLASRFFATEPPGKSLVCVCVCVCVCVLAAQSCLTLWDPMESSPPGSSIHGTLQARILEGVAIPFSRGSSWPRDWTWISCISVRFFTIWATREAPRRLDWVAISFSRGSSQPRAQTWVSYTTDKFFTIWATREAS